jgi:hypothetical protein
MVSSIVVCFFAALGVLFGKAVARCVELEEAKGKVPCYIIRARHKRRITFLTYLSYYK